MTVSNGHCVPDMVMFPLDPEARITPDTSLALMTLGYPDGVIEVEMVHGSGFRPVCGDAGWELAEADNACKSVGVLR